VPQDQAVTVIRLIVPHVQDVPGEINIAKEEIRLIGNVTTYDENGNQIDSGKTMVVPIQEIPPGGVAILKQLYEWVEAEAATRGFIGAGVADVFEAPTET
jgi:hypothetical protein